MQNKEVVEEVWRRRSADLLKRIPTTRAVARRFSWTLLRDSIEDGQWLAHVGADPYREAIAGLLKKARTKRATDDLLYLLVGMDDATSRALIARYARRASEQGKAVVAAYLRGVESAGS